jgi:membrane protein
MGGGAQVRAFGHSARRAISGFGEFWELAGSRNISLISAGIAFYALLAVFPGVAVLVAIWGFLSDPAMVEDQLELIREFLPNEAFALLSGQVRRIVGAQGGSLGVTTLISAVITLWSARLGVGALIQALNAVHGTPQRGGIAHALLAIVLTLALIGVAIAAIGTVVVLPVLLAVVPLGGIAFMALSVANWLVVLAVVLGGVALLYRYGPNRRPRTRWLSPGLWLAVAVWALASLGFTRYLTQFGDYGAVYGSLGAVVALLMWFFISAYAVLLGAVLNVRLERDGRLAPTVRGTATEHAIEDGAASVGPG